VDIAEISATATSYVDSTLSATSKYKYRIIARNVLLGDRYSHPLETTIPIAQSSFLGDPHAIPGVIEAEDYDFGGEGVAYHDFDVNNVGGQYRIFDAVDIEARDSGGYQVGYVQPGEWIEYTVDVADSGRYNVAFEVASLNGGGRINLLVGLVGTDRLIVPTTNSWQTTTTLNTEMDLAAGVQVMRLNIVDIPEYNIEHITFSKITSTGLPERVAREGGFTIYPNPVDDRIVIDRDDSQIATLRLFNILGQKVYEGETTSKIASLDVTSFAPGVYFVELSDSRSAGIRRVVVR
jgi:hypothetical protein